MKSDRRAMALAAALPIALILFGLLGPGCSTARDPWASAGKDRKRVLASFAPLYCFAVNIAGDHAQVMCLTTTTGPHDYAASPRDALKVAGADLFLYNGLGLDNDAVR